MGTLRQLKPEDADRMYEWLQNEDITRYFRFSGMKLSLDSVKNFIKNANSTTSRHYAITNEHDQYMGTVSLKNIDPLNKNAEYAIALHMDAIGNGYARFATDQILKIGFGELGLHRIYLNVLSTNHRAMRFYEKYGFIFEGESREHLIQQGKFQSVKWYSLLDTDRLFNE